MLIVHVHVVVKGDAAEAFEEASRENAQNSLQEPGCFRFDVVRQIDEPNRYVLVEIYRDAEAAAAHKETAHYQRWRDAVEPMMDRPRQSVKYEAVHAPGLA